MGLVVEYLPKILRYPVMECFCDILHTNTIQVVLFITRGERSD